MQCQGEKVSDGIRLRLNNSGDIFRTRCHLFVCERSDFGIFI